MSASSALLVLGMHRSGTSALARVLGLGGANLGSRVLGASAGNEAGHWEDALAVEIHERLFAAFGARWDEPFALPSDWDGSERGRAAYAEIRGYVASERVQQPLWAVKDPRLCLFAPLWREAAAAEGVACAAIVALRHPGEIAHSLAARDGIAPARGWLLWLEHALGAAREAERLPHVVVGYDALLADWRGCVDRIRTLPGGEQLRYDDFAAAAVEGALDRGLRHHDADDGGALPPAIAQAWQMLAGGLRDGRLAPGTSAALEAAIGPLRGLLHPLLDENRVLQRALWERIGRLEAKRTSDDRALALLESSLRLHERDRSRHEEGLDVSRRELAELRGDNARLRGDHARLSELASQFEQLRNSRSWRWTRPLRFAHRAVTGQLSPTEKAKLRGFARSVIATAPGIGQRTRARLIGRTFDGPGGAIAHLPDAAMASKLRLESAREGVADVFVWSVIDWHFRTQRPQHLARAMAARGHRVFYVSVNFVDAAGAGFRVEPLDRDGRLFQVHLHLSGAPHIYADMPDDTRVDALLASLANLLSWTRTTQAVSLVQHPFWSALARAVPNARLVYDCMDHHAGFENNAPRVLAAESRLAADADLVIVTSSWLEAEFTEAARSLALVRNACEFSAFASRPSEVFRDPEGRRVIGYYGAIAEWFDLALVRRVAMEHADALVVLVGHDSIGAGALLSSLPNVRMIGEVPYARLPYWLHGFDVCVLPFRVVPLTLATNPVKVYEYLSAGKPVVAVDLPEMAQFGDLVTTARDADDFARAVGAALAAPPSPESHAARQAFAAGQTWLHRADAIDAALRELAEPLVSVVVLTYNHLALTQACLESIERHSDYSRLEVIVVDNASADGSVAFLEAWAAEPSPAGHARRLILNDTNLGFAAGNNVGLADARGEFLVLLNNDTRVTPGWVRTLCGHLRADPGLGLVGPVTNNIGNEARIAIAYDDPERMIDAAAAYTRAHAGRRRPMRTVAFFCVAMPRAVHAAVGGLDEAFGQGFFEDDDYCRRVEAIGGRIACAEDVFVHHELSASFDRLRQEHRAALFERNKAIYEAKWGPWVPHAYRAADDAAR